MCERIVLKGNVGKSKVLVVKRIKGELEEGEAEWGGNARDGPAYLSRSDEKVRMVVSGRKWLIGYWREERYGGRWKENIIYRELKKKKAL